MAFTRAHNRRWDTVECERVRAMAMAGAMAREREREGEGERGKAVSRTSRRRGQ